MLFSHKVFFAVLSLGYRTEVHSFVTNQRHFSISRSLFSSPTTVDPLVTSSPSDDENKSEQKNIFDNFAGRVSATADYQSFIPSTHGSYGIMAIKLKEEDIVKKVIEEAKDESDLSTSETGMFGGAAAKAAKEMAGKAKKAIQGMFSL